ncbi:MAG TPA: glycoside hydrolase family 127 protein [Chitinophaga sp.]|uniref:glycoside hydrolase family 127 protein n=1 Tax=Chitinophaga sp. TaxID=1869181 RepID=UPI002DB77B30|nr:glycoside hydrolase family 127 protein [Chitinophaga sp.]HEU4551688.1 glycoside hydrolase family 127 protein [Chitinophaga sp.]
MKKIVHLTLILLLIHGAAAIAQDYPIQPVPFTDVKVTDHFWAPRILSNYKVTIPIALEQCYKTGRVDNFMIAGKLKKGKFKTEYPFDDTDIYKIIEGASYSLQTYPDKKLEAQLDTLIYYIGKAQEPDGYLYTNRTIAKDSGQLHRWAGKKRWEKDPELSHELYNSGHLYEAATAHYLATGKRTLLDIAIKNANLVYHDFIEGGLKYYPGHQIIEMGLVKMYRVTNDKRYLDLAKYFLDIRGNGSEYNQAQAPVTEQTRAVGHAVRATYMYSGMADVAALTGDKGYVQAIDAIWHDVVDHKIYITGGIGAEAGHEGFGPDYALPNMSAYNETCASIGNIYWNYRLFLLHGDAKYYDVLEQILYNGMISGVAIKGNRFFYPNPLESMGQHERSEWFGCACCPSNVCRFIPSVPGYVYATGKNRIYANLFVQSTARIPLQQKTVEVNQQTNYPWDGDITFTINPAGNQTFDMAIRLPAWLNEAPMPGGLYTFATPETKKYTISINGRPAEYTTEHGYAVIHRSWKKGDAVKVHFPMDVRYVKAKSQVRADENKTALQRGPLVYCFEWPDNKAPVRHLLINEQNAATASFEPNLLNGVEVIHTAAVTQAITAGNKVVEKEANVTAIPYYAWANRGPGDMTVWVADKAAAVTPLRPATVASRSKVSGSHTTKTLRALNDQLEPASSHDGSVPYYHWWPLKDTVQWVEYDFAAPAKVSNAQVYWYDDGPWGGCRVPASWKLLYKDAAGKWTPVKNSNAYTTNKDAFNNVQFEAVQTSALRMEVQLPKEHAAGIMEWKVD